MPHIQLDPQLPGITALLAYRPETGGPLSMLAETLLRGPSTLSSGERELIAAYVSSRNSCHFCHQSHSAAAAAHLGKGPELAKTIATDPGSLELSAKMRALLDIAAKVQESGLKVQPPDIQAAKDAGATDRELHDTVLIAAAFCMYNRYVDGLATWAPEAPEAYRDMGKMLAAQGYLRPR